MAKIFCSSLTRELSNDELKVRVTCRPYPLGVLALPIHAGDDYAHLGNDGKNDDKYAKTIRWCKEVFSTFRIEERCKVGTIMALVILRHSLFP